MTENFIDESIYNEKSLYLLNIKELRTLGRKLGVPAPASKKKKELVEYILNVVYGKVNLPVRNLYGRPSTHEFDMEKYLDKIKKNSDISDEIKTFSLREDYGLKKVSSPSLEYKLNDNIEKRIFCEENGKYYFRVRGFIKSDDDIEILCPVKEKFKLENFDVVEIIFNESYYKIYSVNGIKVKDKIKKMFIGSKPLMWGHNQDFYLDTKEELKSSIEKLAIDCEINNLKLIILSANRYNGKQVININYSLDEDKSQIYKKIIMFISECEKAVFESEDLIIAIEDYDAIEEIISGFDLDVYVRIKKYFHDVISKIVDLGNIYIRLKIEENFKY